MSLMRLIKALPIVVGLAAAVPLSASAQSFVLGSLPVGSSTTVNDIFTSTPTTSTVANGLTFNFADAYSFSTLGASATASAVTLNFSTLLNISNLQIAIFSPTANPATFAAGSYLGSAGNSTGSVSGGGWSQDLQILPNEVALTNVTLPNGPYVLEVRGDITGSAGGSYLANLTLAAVPEPQTWVMLTAGLVLLGFTVGRRRA